MPLVEVTHGGHQADAATCLPVRAPPGTQFGNGCELEHGPQLERVFSHREGLQSVLRALALTPPPYSKLCSFPGYLPSRTSLAKVRTADRTDSASVA